MFALGYRLGTSGAGRWSSHVNGVDLVAVKRGARWDFSAQLVDESVVVRATAHTLDAAADKVRSRIVDHLPTFARALWLEAGRKAS